MMRDPLTQIVYGIVMLAALLTGSIVFRRQTRQSPLDQDTRVFLGVAALLGAMLGARVPYLWEFGWDGFVRGAVWWADGKTILGGIFGGYLAVELAKYIQGIRISTGDAFVLPVALAVAIGRIGCFWGGCCYGQPTTLPWGVHFPSVDDSLVYRHPTQLYEAAFHLLAAIVFVMLTRYKLWETQRLKAYLLSYLLFRFVTEIIRPEPRLWLNLTAYQLTAVVLSLALIALWFRDARRLRASQGTANIPH